MVKRIVGSVGSAFIYPFNAIGNKVYRKAIISSETLPKEVKSTVEEYQAQGEDFTADLSRKYWRIQSMCIGYRIRKLRDEFTALSQSKLIDYDHTHFIVFLRWCLRLLFLYIVGVMVGRQSMFPLLHPTSPFVETLRKQYDV